eukprot:GHVU01068052.1.p1 GENE.GHVU01068052.1~~GHVU01068052.1.p1  ORF type:complete len:127 (+),score=3.01 GHVU01068052.1:83-463(+)
MERVCAWRAGAPFSFTRVRTYVRNWLECVSACGCGAAGEEEEVGCGGSDAGHACAGRSVGRERCVRVFAGLRLSLMSIYIILLYTLVGGGRSSGSLVDPGPASLAGPDRPSQVFLPPTHSREGAIG